MINDVEEVLVSAEEIDREVSRLAAEINEYYRDKNLLVVCVLKGSLLFTSDLIKKVNLRAEIEFMRVASYHGATVSSGRVETRLEIDRQDLSDYDVLVIEDIVDSGRTLAYLRDYFVQKGAKSFKCCTMLDKPDRRVIDIEPDFTGKIIPDKFVIGYGLDYGEKYRNLPFVGVLKPEVYEQK